MSSFLNEFKWKLSTNELGGKALNLFKLREAGSKVPPLFVVSTRAYEAHIREMGGIDPLIQLIDTSSPSRLAETAGRVRKAIIDQPLSIKTLNELEGMLFELRLNDVYVAVRSSALGEDSKDQSFAGQMDSFLFCKGTPEVAEALKKCWASLFSDRAVSYRKMSQISATPEIAVVIQQMVEGDVSGVCFSVNPLTQKRSELLVTATFGLGEGIVSGALNTDQWVLHKKDLKVLKSEIVEKTQRIVFNKEAQRGTREENCPIEIQSVPSLEPLALTRLAEETLRIEKVFGCPQDIEWTFRNDELFILQTRPITTLVVSASQLIEDEAYETVWDNSNIVESYSGVTTPLTYSFANHCYYMVYVQFCEILGVPKAKIELLDFNFKNMLGLIHGRIYYNLKNWYRLISVLPGYEYNKSFMEQMMGVKDAHRLAPGETLIEGISNRQKYLVELPRLIWVGLNLFYQFFALDRNVKKFINIYQDVYSEYHAKDFSKLSLHELVQAYQDMERRVLRNWKPPIVNDFMAMIFYGVLKKITLKWNLDKTGSLPNQLLGGQGDVESTLPIKRLEEISVFIRSDPNLLRDFRILDRTELKQKYLESNEGNAKLRARIASYLDEYGYRCMNELKLEEPSLKDDPSFLFSILKNYCVSAQASQPSTHGANEAEQALQMVRAKLGNTWKCWVFKFVLNFAKKAVKVREYQRFARTKMFGIMRTLFRAAGKKLHELGALKEALDIFYLTKDEIFGYVTGASVTTDIQRLVELRKQEFAVYKAEDELPDRIVTKGTVYLNESLQRESAPLDLISPTDGILRGTSCCPGKVRGRVKVILSPSDDMSLNGEILVAGRTDPGWVTLYPSASGLLIERGSVLSHSAIVARELRLPAIVGIPSVTKFLKTGDLVEMDGEQGTVIKIEEQAAEVAA